MRTFRRVATAVTATLAIAAFVTDALAAPTTAAARPVKEFDISIAEVEHELYPGG